MAVSKDFQRYFETGKPNFIRDEEKNLPRISSCKQFYDKALEYFQRTLVQSLYNQQFIMATSSEGGPDFPEGLEAALEACAINKSDCELRLPSQSSSNISLDLKSANPEYIRLKNEGNDLHQDGKFEEALEKYKEALQFTSNESEVAALLHNEGVLYERMQKYEEAVKAYSEAIEKRPGYSKVMMRRARLHKVMGQFEEAMDDFVVVACLNMQSKESIDASISPLLSDLLVQYTESEVKKVMESRGGTLIPPKYIIEGFLRPFYCDPVSRLWRGLDKSPVEDALAAGATEDSLTGYLAAVRDLKQKKYENVAQLCSEEIANPESKYLMDAHFLRGTMNLIWGNMVDTEKDLRKVAESSDVPNEMRSSAHLKLALRQVTRHPLDVSEVAEDFQKAEDFHTGNPDVYFHGALTLVDRAHPQEALEMLLHGMQTCGEASPPLLKALYYTIKFSIEPDESAQKDSFAVLREIESTFDLPDCHEMFAQALLMAGEDFVGKIGEQMDKAIAYDPTDSMFKIKKIIMDRFSGNGESLQQLQEYVKTEPNSFAYYHIGQMEILVGNIERGLEAMDKAIELSTCKHELEVRIASKLELKYHLKINAKLGEMGMGSLQHRLEELTLKAFM